MHRLPVHLLCLCVIWFGKCALGSDVINGGTSSKPSPTGPTTVCITSPCVDSSGTEAAMATACTAQKASVPPRVTFVQTIAGSPPQSLQSGFEDGNGTNAKFNLPIGIAVNPDSGVIFVSDRDNCAIRAISPSFNVTTVVGSPPSRGAQCGNKDDGVGTNARINHPRGICILAGVLYLSDYDNNRVRAVNLSGSFAVTTVTAADDDGNGSSQLSGPMGIACDETSKALLVVDSSNSRVRRVDLATQSVTTIAGKSGYADGVGTEAAFSFPFAIAWNPNTGIAYIADAGNDAIRAVTVATGVVTTLAGSHPPTAAEGYVDGKGTNARFKDPRGAALDSHTGGLLVAEHGNHALRWVDLCGYVTTIAGKPPPNADSGHVDGDATTARFSHPRLVAVHPTRPTTYIVADTENHAIKFVYYTTTAHSASHSETQSVAAGSASFSTTWSSATYNTSRSLTTITGTQSSLSTISTSVSASRNVGVEGAALSDSVSATTSKSISRSLTSLSLSKSQRLSATATVSHTHVSRTNNSATATMTVMTPSHSQTVPLPPSFDLAAAAVAKAQASSNVATVASMALGGDPATASQTAFLSIVSCGNRDRGATPPPSSLTMLTISVFYAHGPLAMGFGNLALVAFTLLLHASVTMVVARRTQTDFAAAAGHRFVRFPNFSLRIVAFLVPGTVYAAFLLLLDPASGAGLYAAGSLLLLPVLGLVAARHLLVTRVAIRRAQYVLYAPGTAEKSLSFVEVPLFPNGRWTPQSQRFTFGLLLVPFSPRALEIATVEMCAGLCLAAATAIATTRTAALCAAIMQAMSAVHFAVALWCGVMRPFRLKSDVVCAALTYALYGVVCVLLSLHTTAALAAAANVQVFCAVVSVLRLGAMFWVVWREDLVEQASHAKVLGDPTTSLDDVELDPLNSGFANSAVANPVVEAPRASDASDPPPVPLEGTHDADDGDIIELSTTACADQTSALLNAGCSLSSPNDLLADVDGYFSPPSATQTSDNGGVQPEVPRRPEL